MFRNKYLLIILTVCLVTTSCGSEEVSGWTEEGHGELPQEVGDVTRVYEYPDTLMDPDRALWEYTEYEAPTGQWFAPDKEFVFSLTGGEQPAGAPVSVSIRRPEGGPGVVDRQLRIQLTERTMDYDLMDMIDEEVIGVEEIPSYFELYSTQLPEKENALYILSLEILDENTEVEDTRLSLIYVPGRDINAMLKTDHPTYTQGDTLTLILKNAGPASLFHGVSYSIERYEDGRWLKDPKPRFFILIGYTLLPGNTYEQEIDIGDLEPGKYRVIKTFTIEAYDEEVTLAAEFEVVDNT